MFAPPDTPAFRREPRRPATGIQGFWDGVFAGFKAESIEIDYWSRSAKTERDVFEDVYDRVGNVLGSEELDRRIGALRHPRRSSRHGRYGYAWQKAMLEVANDVGAAYPEMFGDLALSRDGVRNEATKRMQAEYADAIESLGMTADFPGLANFLGRGAAASTDPTSLALMFFGGPQGSVMKIVAREAMLNGLGEALTLRRQFQQAERLGIPKPNPVTQIALGAVFAGALAGGSKLLYRSGRDEVFSAIERAAIYAKARLNCAGTLEPQRASLTGKAAVDAAGDSPERRAAS